MDIFQSTANQESKAKNETIIVDYIGANVGKPLHIGHICTPSIGQVICNVYRHLGYDVIGDSHFGDWGGIFGKLITAWKDNFPEYWNKQATIEEVEKYKIDELEKK